MWVPVKRLKTIGALVSLLGEAIFWDPAAAWQLRSSQEELRICAFWLHFRVPRMAIVTGSGARSMKMKGRGHPSAGSSQQRRLPSALPASTLLATGILSNAAD